MPDLGRISVVGPSNLCRGYVPRVAFPTILGKMSIEKKSKRMLRELREAAGTAFYADRTAIQNEHLPLIFDMILDCLEGEINDRNIRAAARILL